LKADLCWSLPELSRLRPRPLLIFVGINCVTKLLLVSTTILLFFLQRFHLNHGKILSQWKLVIKKSIAIYSEDQEPPECCKCSKFDTFPFLLVSSDFFPSKYLYFQISNNNGIPIFILPQNYISFLQSLQPTPLQNTANNSSTISVIASFPAFITPSIAKNGCG